ncbi:MAG TPA: aspartate aminotransferase family protein [Patescibacteria group bacterium]|nr:aspartate aminotransferase family protein [Patescibacteria group bacterium]
MIKNNIIYSDFCDWTFGIKKAEGSFLWNTEGKKLIDFTSGWNVTNLGWNNPEVNVAIIKQARKNVYAAMWMDDPIQEEYAEELVKSLPKGLSFVCRATGGTDANEKAMLMARALTKRQKIIGCLDTYHGHSFGTISIGYRPEWARDVAPLVPEFIKINFPKSTNDSKKDVDVLRLFVIELEKLLKNKDVAAMVTEAGIITGWGSTFVAPKGYLEAVRKITKKYGTLLILDEVGTGFSRCGKLFGMEIEGIVPDMSTFAKGMSNGGAAIGAVVVNNKFNDVSLSASKTHSTFGWTSVACAASLATLKVHKRDRLWEKSKKDGDYIMNNLKKELADHPRLGEIQGLGMEIGIMFVKDKKSMDFDDAYANKVIKECYKKGLHLILGGDGNIQIMPPLTIDRKVLDDGLDKFLSVVNRLR